jgi:mono/diheme cytochrome c family protein
VNLVLRTGKGLRPFKCTAAALLLLQPAAWAQESLVWENADHAGIISRWDAQSLARGQQLFQVACAPCHGTNGVQTINPQARPFAVEKFQNGNDPFRMFKTITSGFKNMPSQTWMTPEQRYDVIQYIREKFVKPLNPDQYFPIDRAYLDSLPKFNPALAQAASEAKAKQRDFGPVLESQLSTNFPDVLTFRLNENVTVSYDLHRMRLAGAWQGGFLDLSRTGNFQQRGEGQPLPQGKFLPGLQQWCWGFGGRFDYPTNDLLPRGPLPPAWMKYLGHYVNGRNAALSYSIEGRSVLEWPSASVTNGLATLSHTLRLGAGATSLRLCVGQSDVTGGRIQGLVALGETKTHGTSGAVTGNLVLASRGDADPAAAPNHSWIGDFVAAGAAGQTDGLTWEVDDHQRLILDIPADTKPRVVQVLCTAGWGQNGLDRLADAVRQAQSEGVTDPETLTHGSARLWPMPVEVRGKPGQQPGAYVLDTIPVPFENPYNSWLRTSALAFFPDGRAVVTTYGGDVWIVSGLDLSLEHVTWSRFASGLYEPFGAQVINDLIYVTCRNGIVRLHDLNKDGEADYYETFYADTDVSTFFHSFNFDLQVDSRGHLFFVKAGEYTDFKLPGAVVELNPNGTFNQYYCTGFRVPNGMGILPDDRLTVSDNQGDWMPAGKINLIHHGGSYGYIQTHEGGGAFGDHWAPDGGKIDAHKVEPPATFDQPIIWMPQEFDNSCAAQVWTSDPRFGPLSGRLLHTSFGKGWMYYLTLQEIGSVAQAAIIALPFQFDAGLMRARVNPADGQVYATGLSGWQGPPDGKDGCLQRLRYTGKPVKLLDDAKFQADGLSLRFNFALDAASACDASSYHLEQWNYLWSHNYGSDQYSLEHPGQKGHDVLKASSIKMDPDGRGVFLAIPGLRPVNQVELRLNVGAGDSTRFKELVYLTINALPGK